MSKPIRSLPRLQIDRWSAAAAACVACWAAGVLLLLVALPAAAGTVKVGVLKFGTVNWEIDVISRNGLDRAVGVELEAVELATNAAVAVALQAGAVDVIVTDWLWVTRQRADGADYTFVPYSTSIGSLVVPANSEIRALPDLKGRRLGIAGGPVDKSWLLFRAFARQHHGFDLARAVEEVFGAPPLLNEQLELGEIDAVINNWNFVAQLEAKGFERLMGAADAARELGISSDVPMLGYVFSEAWALSHREDVQGLVDASRRAKSLLLESDDEWLKLQPLMGATDEDTFLTLRDEFRRGVPRSWGDTERADAKRLFSIMADLGGPALVGQSQEIQPGTFWPEVVY